MTKPYIQFTSSVCILINYKSYLIFLFASLAVSIGLQMILPFPYGLGAALALFIAFPILLRRRMMNRMKGGFGSSSSSSGGFGSGLFGQNNDTASKVKFVCIVCDNEHGARQCPRCGSKQTRPKY